MHSAIIQNSLSKSSAEYDGIGDSDRRENVLKLEKNSKIPLIVFSVVSGYLLLGLIFYKYTIPQWTFYTAFFYSVQSGYAVGFGNVSEPENAIHLFTCFYIILSGSLVSTSMYFYLTWLTRIKREMEIMLKVLNPVALRNEYGEITPKQFLLFLWYHAKYMLGWYSNPSRVIKCFILAIWVGLGFLYQYFYNQDSWLNSIFFAVTSCSAGKRRLFLALSSQKLPIN